MDHAFDFQAGEAPLAMQITASRTARQKLADLHAQIAHQTDCCTQVTALADEERIALEKAQNDGRTEIAQSLANSDTAYNHAENVARNEFSRIATELDRETQASLQELAELRQRVATVKGNVSEAQTKGSRIKDDLKVAQRDFNRFSAEQVELKRAQIRSVGRVLRNEEKAQEERDLEAEVGGDTGPQQHSGAHRSRSGTLIHAPPTSRSDMSALKFSAARSKSAPDSVAKSRNGQEKRTPTTHPSASLLRIASLASAEGTAVRPVALAASRNRSSFLVSDEDEDDDEEAGKWGCRADFPVPRNGVGTTHGISALRRAAAPDEGSHPALCQSSRAAGGDPDDEGAFAIVVPALPSLPMTGRYQGSSGQVPVSTFSQLQQPGRVGGSGWGKSLSSLDSIGAAPPVPVAPRIGEWSSNAGWEAQLTSVPSARPPPPPVPRSTSADKGRSGVAVSSNRVPSSASLSSGARRGPQPPGHRSVTLGGTNLTVLRMPMHASHPSSSSKAEVKRKGSFDFDDFGSDDGYVAPLKKDSPRAGNVAKQSSTARKSRA